MQPRPLHELQSNQRLPSGNGLCTKECWCGSATCLICSGKVSAHDDKVSCVPVGSWCGVAMALNKMKLRTQAFPMDWVRVNIEGTSHFLRTHFADFLAYDSVADFEWDKENNGGKSFSGPFHSFWHDDLTKQEVHAKYHRRIERFLQNPARTLLFIYACNSNDEVKCGEHLLRQLQALFHGSQQEILLLMLVDGQLAEKTFVVEGTDGCLLIYLTKSMDVKTMHDVPRALEAYMRGIAAALDHAEGRPIVAVRVRDLAEFADVLEPYWGGDPRKEAYSLERDRSTSQRTVWTGDWMPGRAAAPMPASPATPPRKYDGGISPLMTSSQLSPPAVSRPVAPAPSCLSVPSVPLMQPVPHLPGFFPHSFQERGPLGGFGHSHPSAYSPLPSVMPAALFMEDPRRADFGIGMSNWPVVRA
mmetsp:Transcript_20411/g.47591  ORF Transcript_20411/g.47591 Transcript_20411/m.47591 type:complete len:416 (+) Transcript_20411:51-1298(+)